MRHSRRLATLVYAPILLASLAACSDDANSVTVGEAIPAEGEATSPETVAEVPEPEETSPPVTEPEETTTTAEPTTTTIPDPTAEAFGWSEIGPGIEEGRLTVPIDYDDPSVGEAQIYVVRRRATDPENRIGALLVNPGGPGAGGTVLAEFADQIYGEDLLARFDIVGFDPRGTGLSEPTIDCTDDLDPYFGIETGPDTPEEDAALQAAAKEFADGCLERTGDLLAHVSTVDAATDMDSIRQALGEETISYFGWSYGTALGATWATLFPDTVRAAVLDGAINPTTGRVEGLVDQAAGFDSTLSTYLAACAADPTCEFNSGGDTIGAFAAVLAQVEAGELTSAPDRPAITQGIFELGVAQALYSEEAWPALNAALAAAANDNDGTGLLALYDGYYGRAEDGTYSNDLEAYFAITCADDPDTGGIDGAVDARGDFAAASPRISTASAYEVLICA
jgi:pimeloyl-ACP methyl ester carboxylesterase